jgi:hypothetical protein
MVATNETIATVRTNDVPARVTVVDFDMSFGHLVRFFIKAAFAAIPAMIIVWLVFVVIAAMVAAVFGTAWWAGAGRV